jgi:hypothetical protein
VAFYLVTIAILVASPWERGRLVQAAGRQLT